jgi:serine/threonine-protein kinase
VSDDTDKTERWRLVDQCFDEVLDAPADRREAVLRAMGETYPEAVVAEVRALVDAVDSTHPVFASPAPAQVDVLEPAPEPPPSTIGRWRLGDRIGSGGQGQVYRATKHAEQFVQTGALKILGDHLSQSAMQRFLRERQTLARLRHPNIAALLDAGASDDGRPYLVSDLIDGMTLDRFIDARRPSTTDCVKLLLPIIDAVAYAHQQFVLHRDIKPTNIMVDADGIPYLLDFGVSAAIADAAGGEHNDAGFPADPPPYTPSYAAPEQILNRPVDVRTDCWALGALLYRACARSNPFVAEDAQRTVHAVVHEPAKPLSGDRELNAIVQKCLSKSLEARYGTVTELRDDLQAWLDDGPVRAAAGSRWYLAGKWLKRHRLLATSGLLLACSLMIGTVVSGYQAQRAAEQRDRATAAARQYQTAVGLLAEVFNGANPAERRGRVPSADDLLAEAFTRVQAMDGQPGVRAALAHELAAVYLNRGEAERAARLATAAIDHFDASEQTDSETYANTLVSLATAHKMLGRYDAAMDRLEQSLRVQRRHLWSTDDWRYAYTENMLGGVQSLIGEPAQAKDRFASALRSLEDSAEAPRWLLGTVRRNYWDARFRLGEPARARRALSDGLQEPSPDAPEEAKASALASLGEIALADAQYPEARQHYAKAARLLAEVYGQSHPDVLLYGERAAYADFLVAAETGENRPETLSQHLARASSPRSDNDQLSLTTSNQRLSLTPYFPEPSRTTWVRNQLEAGPDAPAPDRLLWHQHLLLRAIGAQLAGLEASAQDALTDAAAIELYDTDQAAWQREIEKDLAELIDRGDPADCRSLKALLIRPLALELTIALRGLACETLASDGGRPLLLEAVAE